MVGWRRMEVGEVVDGRFEIGSLAGSGGMAEVYRATERGTGRAVAVKVLHRRAATEVARFEREAALLGQLQHPCIVDYLGQGLTDDGRPYLVMEWLEGRSLSERLREGPLSVMATLEVAQQVASALRLAHRKGIVHRDLKPSNLFLIDDDTSRVVLLDFGVAGVRDAERALTHTGVMIGSPGYMSPEQVRGEKVDARADVFGLGCVIFRCLTGRPAYRGEVLAVLAKIVADPVPRVTEVDPGLPEPLAALVHRMMAKSAERRPADGGEVLAALDALGSLDAIEAAPRSSIGLTRAERRVQCLLLVQLGKRVGPTVPPPPPEAPAPGADPVAGAEPAEAISDATQPDEPVTVADAEEGATAVAVPRGLAARRQLRLALARHGGTVDVLPEGSLLVTITGASHLTDQMERAARCALAVREAVGMVPMALVAGHDVTTTGTAFGHLVDRAVALLETDQGATAIRLDDVTAGLLDSRFEIGGDEGGLVLEAERQEQTQRRTLLGQPVPCVGRERILSMLEGELYECISEPVARAVIVTADAGMGKTRVMQEFVSNLQRGGEPLAIWSTSGHPMSSGSAFAMAAELVRRAAGVRADEPPELSRRKVAARVARFVPERDCARVQRFVGEMCGLPEPSAETAGGRALPDVQLREARRDPRIMSDQIRQAWLDLCLAECTAQPLVIVLEDLHFGDLPTVELVDLLLRELEDQPLMVLAAARPEVHQRFLGLWDRRDPTEVRLPPLTPRNAHKLVRAALGKRSTRALEERIVERAAGNAFFLEELIRAAAAGAEGKLPETVLAMAQERLERLDPEARRVLRAASVFGNDFSAEGIDALLGDELEPDRAAEWLATLVEDEILVQAGASRSSRRFGFRHAMVQEAAYAMLTRTDRALGHRLAAAYLAAQESVDPLVLATHLERGAQPDRAAEAYLLAAEQALDGHDLDSALQHVAAAGRCGATGQRLGKARLVQARAHQWRGDFAAMQQAALQALQLVPANSVAWLEAMRSAAQASGKLGEHSRLEALATELLSVTDEVSAASVAGSVDGSVDDALADDETYAAYLAALAVCAIELLFAGRRKRAAALLRRLDDQGLSATLTDTEVDGSDEPAHPRGAERRVADERPAVAAAIHAARAFDALYAGRLGDYLAQARQAMDCFDAAGDRRVATLYRINVGYALVAKGDVEEGHEALTAALFDAERMGVARLIALAKNNLGTAALHLGDVARARELQADAVEAYAASGNHRMEGGSRRNLAAALLAAGELEEAEEQAHCAVAILEVAPPLRAHALATLADVLLARGRAQEAVETTTQALAIGGDLEDGET